MVNSWSIRSCDENTRHRRSNTALAFECRVDPLRQPSFLPFNRSSFLELFPVLWSRDQSWVPKVALVSSDGPCSRDGRSKVLLSGQRSGIEVSRSSQIPDLMAVCFCLLDFISIEAEIYSHKHNHVRFHKYFSLNRNLRNFWSLGAYQIYEIRREGTWFEIDFIY